MLSLLANGRREHVYSVPVLVNYFCHSPKNQSNSLMIHLSNIQLSQFTYISQNITSINDLLRLHAVSISDIPNSSNFVKNKINKKQLIRGLKVAVITVKTVSLSEQVTWLLVMERYYHLPKPQQKYYALLKVNTGFQTVCMLADILTEF